MEFLNELYKILILIAFFSQKSPSAPPQDKFLATPLVLYNGVNYSLHLDKSPNRRLINMFISTFIYLQLR